MGAGGCLGCETPRPAAVVRRLGGRYGGTVKRTGTGCGRSRMDAETGVLLVQEFNAATLRFLREAVVAHASAAGLPEERAIDVMLAVHELAANAVEETMRHSPVIFAAARTAVEDVDLGGVVIPAGTFVLANMAAANRDPAVYDEPDRLDITRDGPPAMLTFGGGAHYCLGANLARLELSEALAVMTRRMPRPRRTGPAPWKPIVVITGPTTLPIEFDVAH